MIFRWVHHTNLKPWERLMMVMFEMGMATLEDLSIVMGYSEKRIFRMYQHIRDFLAKSEIEKLNQEAKEIEKENYSKEEKEQLLKEIQRKIQEEKNLYAKPHRQIVEHRGSASRLYSLGQKGIEYCMTLIHEKGSWDIKESQLNHYNGINKILIRLIKVFGKENLRWHYSYEATEVIFRVWEVIRQEEWAKNPSLARQEKRRMIRPDALCIIANSPYWIEFDNDTERMKQLIEKYLGYCKTIGIEETININYPIIWITTHSYRRDEMKRIWETVKEEYYPEQAPIEMEFFVQGEEADWFMKRHADLLDS